MAVGWAGDGAEQDQINSTVEDGIARARSALPKGESLRYCAQCGEEIPAARRSAIPGVRLCVRCQQAQDVRHDVFSGYNRRGSKDSQLR
ncbi:DksA/TraR family C4-type zinc finger protein [Entomohabitans teleogrylli]|uniref:DksA/TraR family C4-type zinc finger protein n=1 Tax=Entomohabitans teleogrylli TaxID=1384589 RepID=UPI00073D1D66|nr:DksA/TraR family C4-type zinc finger protein [Entomohabitans teleogrylli]